MLLLITFFSIKLELFNFRQSLEDLAHFIWFLLQKLLGLLNFLFSDNGDVVVIFHVVPLELLSVFLIRHRESLLVVPGLAFFQSHKLFDGFETSLLEDFLVRRELRCPSLVIEIGLDKIFDLWESNFVKIFNAGLFHNLLGLFQNFVLNFLELPFDLLLNSLLFFKQFDIGLRRTLVERLESVGLFLQLHLLCFHVIRVVLVSAPLFHLLRYLWMLQVLLDHFTNVGLTAISITDSLVKVSELLVLDLILSRYGFGKELTAPELHDELLFFQVLFARLAVLVGVHQLAVGLPCDLVQLRRGNVVVRIVAVL
jgi:hypothetical protein